MKQAGKILLVAALVLVLATSVQAAQATCPDIADEDVCWVDFGSLTLPDSSCDGVPDSMDNCPCTYNPAQADSTGDGVGDACSETDDNGDGDDNGDNGDDNGDNGDREGSTIYCPNLENPCTDDDPTCWVDFGDLILPDSDRDGVPDSLDNCPCTPNPDQTDSNSDGVGDACSEPVSEQLEIAKQASHDELQPGQSTTYTITLTGQASSVRVGDSQTNTGNADISTRNVQVQGATARGDLFGSGLTLNELDGTATITYTATAHGQGVITNTAQAVTRTQSASATHELTISETTPPPSSDEVTIDKTVTPRTSIGEEEVTYQLTIRGSGDELSIKDSFSEQATLTSGGAQVELVTGSEDVQLSGAGSWSGSVSEGYTVTDFDGELIITYDTQATPGSSTRSIRNTATVQTGSLTESSQATLTLQPLIQGQAAFSVVKGVTNRLPRHGQTIGYTVTVTNRGDEAGDVTVRDTIGMQTGTLEGVDGGRIEFLGNKQVTARQDGRNIQVQQSGSITSPNGMTLYDVPPGARIIVTYNARALSDDLARGVESRVVNQANLSTGASDQASVILSGAQQVSGEQRPTLQPIPTQILTCGEEFPTLPLADYVRNPANAEYDLSVSGNRLLQVALNHTNWRLSVTDPLQEGAFTERLQVQLQDEQGRVSRGQVTYRVLDTYSTAPQLAGIPDQTIYSNQRFDRVNLADYVQVADTADLAYYARGSELLSVQVSDSGRVTIGFNEDLFHNNPDLGQITEAITFGVAGCMESQDTAVFTVVNNEVRSTPQPGTGKDRTCAIQIDGRLYDDTDCDGVPDIYDNCPYTYNPDQTDSSGDGVGDACDALVSCSMRARTVQAGQAAVVDVLVENNLQDSLTNPRVSMHIPQLGISNGYTLRSVQSSSAEQTRLQARIPACTQPGTYEVECSLQAGSIRSSTSTSVQVRESDLCRGSQGSEADVFEVQDVLAGSEYGSSFPITVRNNEQSQRTYRLSVEGIAPWGDYVFESGSVAVIPAGGEQHMNLRVFAPPGLSGGEYPFRVSIRSGDDVSEAVMVARVQESSGSQQVFDWFAWVDVLVVFFLFGVAALLLYNTRN